MRRSGRRQHCRNWNLFSSEENRWFGQMCWNKLCIGGRYNNVKAGETGLSLKIKAGETGLSLKIKCKGHWPVLTERKYKSFVLTK